jgi:hypothetical protein
MPRARRHWLRFSWSLWIIFLGLAAAVACASHPLSHDHHGGQSPLDQHGGHPPLCSDTNSPATLGNEKPILSSNGGTFPLSAKSLFPLVFLAALSNPLLVGLLKWPGARSQGDTRTSVYPSILYAVLRL